MRAPTSFRSLLRALRVPAPMLILVALLAGPAPMVACGGDDDSGTGPQPQSVCSRISLASNGISFAMNCGSGSVNSSISGIQYDQFGRRTSYNFDIQCSGGSNRLTGRVTNISYNNLGQALSATVEVNGATCRL